MSEFLSAQTSIFLQACILGMALAVCYDAFRIFRLAIKHNVVVVFLEDVAYFVFITLVTFGFFLAYNDGELRMFILFSELMGAVIYFFSLSVIIIGLSKKIIALVKTVLRIVLFPFYWLIKKIYCLFSLIFNKSLKKAKKILKNIEIHLKTTIQLVYNKHRE